MDDPMFAIDTLNLRLPHGFADRADAIARQVGKELARLSIHQDAYLPAMRPPNISVHGGESNGVIARRIARAIHRQIRDVHVP